MKLDRMVNLADLERAAKRRLPKPIYDIVEGGAGDEVTMAANQSGFSTIRLRPRALVDVQKRDLRRTVLGAELSMPVMLDPCGYQRMVHRDAELAVARAAGALGAGFALSSVSSYPMESVARVATGPKWYQLYLSDHTDTEAIIDRAEQAGFDALCLTVDIGMRALRERDTRNGFTMPLRFTPRIVASGAVRPAWAIDFLRGGAGRNTGAGMTEKMLSVKNAGSILASTFRPVTVEDVEFIRSRWSGPLVIKGILRGDDAARMVDLGADGVLVSNHGGRQLDGVAATIEALPEVVQAVAGRAEVFLDGGVRRGTDVIKAIGLGARAVLFGRPYIYGLAVAGEAGVRRALEIIRDETENAMGLIGARNLAEVTRDSVRLPHEWAQAGI